MKGRTDIAPKSGNIIDVVCPDNSVDGIDYVGQKEPGNHANCRHVSCSPVPWQSEENGQGGEEGHWRELGMTRIVVEGRRGGHGKNWGIRRAIATPQGQLYADFSFADIGQRNHLHNGLVWTEPVVRMKS